MKTIIATSLNFTPLRTLESVTFYYDDSTNKTILINRLSHKKVSHHFSLLKFYAGEFQ